MIEFMGGGKWWWIAMVVGVSLFIWGIVGAIKEQRSKNADKITRKVLKALGQKICDAINTNFRINIEATRYNYQGHYSYKENIPGYMSFSFKKTKGNAIFTFFPRDPRDNRKLHYYRYITMPLSLSRDELVTFIENSANELLKAFNVHISDMKAQEA